MQLSLLNTLGILDCAILVRAQNNKYSLLDSGGSWLSKLLPNSNADKAFHIKDASIFLSDFLIDAEEFWSKKEAGRISSGIWTEQCKDTTMYLEAYATYHENKCFLIIKNVEQLYYERKQTLQIARELHISNEAVVERHDYLTERIRSILVNDTHSDNLLPLHEAIKYATIGIIIVDSGLEVHNVNPCAFQIFEQSDNLDQDYLLATVHALIERQYPEQKIFKNKKHFTGELFWHLPPIANKWLNVNIDPVFGESGKLTYWIISFSDQTRIKHLLQANEELALHDSLTGLPNRQYFWQQLQQNIANQQAFYLLSIDIVNFKYVNELYGYAEGDEILIQISHRFKSILNLDDFITRAGADEFMIIRKVDDNSYTGQNNASIESLNKQMLDFAQQIYDTCVQPLYTKDKRRCELQIKIGISGHPNHAEVAEDLMNCADLALSFAKLNPSTKAPIQIYSNALKIESENRYLLEEALREAIDNEELELYLQPIYNLSSKKIVKAEALLRWHHNGQIFFPDKFIPIAESSGSINALGRWVINRSYEIINEILDIRQDLPISINFSPKQIYDHNLVSFIKNKIEPKNAHLLELEVTENVLITNYEKVSAFLKEIKEHGISISVDDFGTGYCSLAYLKHLPIDTLKIDRSFIQDLDNNEDDGAIVAAIIALAQKLNLKVIAEGIETSAQEKFLVDNNCKKAQGFLYSKALPLDKFKDLLRNT